MWDMCIEAFKRRAELAWAAYKRLWVSVVPINRITIGNSKLLGNFLTIGIGRFYDCTIGLLK